MESIKDHDVTLFVTHAPPADTQTDVLPSGVHVGSESIRKVIEEFQPSLNLCGHIHESMAMDEIGETKVVNPGMLSEGYVCIIDIDDSDEENIKVTPEIIKI
jgi:Icc-related predicted phosphoesterase